MQIRILQLLDGAQRAEGLTVMIDVFRAFSFEPYAFQCGVKKILPVSTYEEAVKLYEQDNRLLLAGEDQGRKLTGFHFGNSPSEIEKQDLRGRVLIHRSSAGIQGILSAQNAEEIITGGLVNAGAVVEYIRKRNPQKVSLVCMGWMSQWEAEEDTLCAQYIKASLEGKSFPIEEQIALLPYTAGAKFFDPTQQDVFPQEDYPLCTRLNCFDFVLKASRQEGRIVITKV